MLCPNCSCELPATAKFCSGCGAAIECPTFQVPAQTPVPASSDPPSDRSVPGRLTEQEALLPPDIATALPTIPTQEAPPYAAFVLHSLGFALGMSVVAFEIANNLAHGYWRSTAFVVGGLVIAVVSLGRAMNRWGRITESGGNPVYLRKLLTRAIVFTLLFLATAAIVGSAIGKSGQETAEMVADLKEIPKIDNRISEARTAAARSVPAQIEMYSSIEPDVRKFDTVLHRLQAELAVYDTKFPGQHDEIEKSIRSVEVGLKRAEILNQQIRVANEITPLDAAAQWKAWQGKMQPLLSAEAALDKD